MDFSSFQDWHLLKEDFDNVSVRNLEGVSQQLCLLGAEVALAVHLRGQCRLANTEHFFGNFSFIFEVRPQKIRTQKFSLLLSHICLLPAFLLGD